MSALNKFASVLSTVASIEDQSKVQEASFERRVIPAGVTFGRLIEYVELGPQKQTYMGQPKPDCEEVRVTFELLMKKNKYVGGNGETMTDTISWQGAKKFNPKSAFYKLFKQMTYGRQITHMANMLGEAFQLTVYHNAVEKAGKTTVYANLFQDGACSIGAPVTYDAETDTQKKVAVPEATRSMKLFIWKNPSVECWDSLFIDGTRTVKVDGIETEKSKNWIQERLLGSPAYKGSALEAMLNKSEELPTEQMYSAASADDLADMMGEDPF